MTDSDKSPGKGEKGKRKPSGVRKRNPPKQPEEPDDGFQVNLISALNHPLRRKILRCLHEANGSLSSARLTERLGGELSCVSYHVTVLAGFDALKKAGEQPVRGAIEHLYLSRLADDPIALELLESTRESDEKE